MKLHLHKVCMHTFTKKDPRNSRILKVPIRDKIHVYIHGVLQHIFICFYAFPIIKKQSHVSGSYIYKKKPL